MTTDQDLRRAWDELAAAAADVEGDAPALAALSGVVLALERTAGASLGTADVETTAVLQRRLARVHRLVGSTVSLDLVRQNLAALRCWAPAPIPEHSAVPVTSSAGPSVAAGWCSA